MAASDRWQPEWTVPPGEILAEVLEERGISQSELARRIHRPVKTINEIVHGKTALTPETAIQLEFALDIPAGTWNGLEAVFREDLARRRFSAELEDFSPWAEKFPFRALVDNGLIPAGLKGDDRVAALLGFFGVSRPEGWENQWEAPQAQFRASPAFQRSPHAVSAWLRWGDILAAEIDTAPFNTKRLRQALDEAKTLTKRDPALIVDRLRRSLAGAGVALVLTPELGSTRLSGAARWLTSSKAVLQLSLRHKTDDQFWFSLFHEAAHLLQRRRVSVVDGSDEPTLAEGGLEEAADRWARNALVDKRLYDWFVARGEFSEGSVRSLAADTGVAPGIVVGRLQRDRHVDQSRLNHLKRTIAWT